MKKTLAILMVFMFVMSTACVTSAAAPFSAVPADHWSYKAVGDLAKAGIIVVYGDGTFHSERLLTRYEMAIIVANAMTNADKADPQQKALIEKLTSEFSVELDKLGVGPSKAAEKAPEKAPEKPRMTISATQQFFVANSSVQAGTVGAYPTGPLANQTFVGERLRLYFNAADTENRFLLNARLYQARSNEQRSGAESVAGTSNAALFDRYWLTAKDIFGGTVDVGKQGLYLGKGAFVGWSGQADFVGYTNKSGITTTRIGEGNLSGYGGTGEISFAQVFFKPDSSSDFGLLYYQDITQHAKIYDVHGTVGLAKGMGLMFEVARNDFAGVRTTGEYVALMSKATACDMVPQNNWTLVNPSKLYDSGWGLSYRHLPAGVSGSGNINSAASFTTILTDSSNVGPNTFNDVNVWGFDYYYVPIKNFQWTLEYNNIKPIHASWHNNYIVSSLTFFF
ncbi:MAG: S-layer homology domain-containing protein [Anaerolineaceae bacterium]|nr:S-layer homology domain-containing protein [Anaerolineaceae bacterium]